MRGGERNYTFSHTHTHTHTHCMCVCICTECIVSHHIMQCILPRCTHRTDKCTHIHIHMHSAYHICPAHCIRPLHPIRMHIHRIMHICIRLPIPRMCLASPHIPMAPDWCQETWATSLRCWFGIRTVCEHLLGDFINMCCE